MIVDANVILRYLLNDLPEQAKLAFRIINNNNIFIPNEIFAEVVYVLDKVYKVSRKEIAESLTALAKFTNINTHNLEVIVSCFEYYQSTNLDFVDCLLCAYKSCQKESIFTFDKALIMELSKIEEGSNK